VSVETQTKQHEYTSIGSETHELSLTSISSYVIPILKRKWNMTSFLSTNAHTNKNVFTDLHMSYFHEHLTSVKTTCIVFLHVYHIFKFSRNSAACCHWNVVYSSIWL